MLVLEAMNLVLEAMNLVLEAMSDVLITLCYLCQVHSNNGAMIQLPVQDAHKITVLLILRLLQIACELHNINCRPFWIAQTDSKVTWEFVCADQNG